MVCAPTNVAVDNLLLKVAEHNIKPLRIGDPLKVSDGVLKYSLSEIVDNKMKNKAYRNKYDEHKLREQFKRTLLEETQVLTLN